jgi:hypothetical protein
MEVARAIPTDIGIITIIRLSTALVAAVIHPLAAHAVAVAAEASAVVVVPAVVAAEAAAVWVVEDNTDR